MTCFFVSDLHIDFYAPLTRTVPLLRRCFEDFFEKHFLLADVCCIAGDIANNYFTYVEFLKFISEKYSQVYICLGNHDVITEREGVFGADRDFPTSESKIAFYLQEAAKIPNVHLLENSALGGFAGCMGMCDFSYKHNPDARIEDYKLMWKVRWFDGRHWNYKGNDVAALWAHYKSVMNDLTAARPKIMMTHFLPMEFGMAEMYLTNPNSTYFFFQGDEFLKNLDEGSIWQAGHTHSAIKRVVRDSLGKSHLLLCNPVGYPTEHPYEENNLKREDFLLEI
ncbi:metallophosphoesterase [Fibrobacter sp. UWEL]|uniref:metallophosphoesterase n=1 Tax=Fibrobacter sp. UWEL TaxID=1896209 RepID=UPI000920EFAC|nr:metallophosphoesterase [Fibrobacter sp. UWEL]SHK96308.1 Calcineurin-like phosphoesterase [Fibrobacter sp. UWEL]